MEFGYRLQLCHVYVVLLLSSLSHRVLCDGQNHTTQGQSPLTADAETSSPAPVHLGPSPNGLTEDQTRTQYQILIKILSKQCARHYTGSCLKLDVLKIMNSLYNSDSYQIIPGISLKFEKTAKRQLPIETVRSMALENETTDFDKYFYEKIKTQLNAVSIHFKLFDDDEVQGKTLDTSIWSDLYKSIRGRKKNQGMKNALKNAGMVAGSTLLIMSMKTIMAFSVKAFMAALASLMISAMSSYRSKGGHSSGYTHGGSTTYEIIAKPMISHSNSIAIPAEQHAEAVSESSNDHYRRTQQYFDANLDYEPQYGVPKPVPIPIHSYSPHGIIYHAQIKSV